MSQLALLADPELCNYGLPKLGERRLCSSAATHAARLARNRRNFPTQTVSGWMPGGWFPEGPRASSGEVRCCLQHANYYAQGWLSPALIFPAVRDTVWLEVL